MKAVVEASSLKAMIEFIGKEERFKRVALVVEDHCYKLLATDAYIAATVEHPIEPNQRENFEPGTIWLSSQIIKGIETKERIVTIETKDDILEVIGVAYGATQIERIEQGDTGSKAYELQVREGLLSQINDIVSRNAQKAREQDEANHIFLGVPYIIKIGKALKSFLKYDGTPSACFMPAQQGFGGQSIFAYSTDKNETMSILVMPVRPTSKQELELGLNKD